MHLNDLDRELREHGFERVRQKGSHRIYRHASGHSVTIRVHCGGRQGAIYSRAEIKDIRRSLARALALAGEAGGAVGAV
jgi:predicted RNA binding protein YcfA (HicA-like mRNA interferase family)